MYRLRLTLAELEVKQDSMIQQEAKRLEPEEEKAQLLARVKSDNAEVALMEQQIKEATAQLERLQNELKEVDSVSPRIFLNFNSFYRFGLPKSYEESKSERGQKYRDLRKREQVMDEFLNNWAENCAAERDRLTQLEGQIVLVLNKLGKQHSLMHLVPRYGIRRNQ